MPQGTDDLIAGETLSTPDGQTETVVGTTSIAEPQGVAVYNLTVADDHTYFVEGFGSGSAANGTTGSNGTATTAPPDAVWVHNTCDLPEGLNEWSQSDLKLAQRHHIISTYANASEWVPMSQEILANASIDLQDERNIVDVAGHIGPHPEAYHLQVYDELNIAVRGLKEGSDEYIAAVQQALSNLKTQLMNPSDPLTQLITR